MAFLEVIDVPQTIKAEVIMEIPEDQVIITRAEFNEYQELKDDGRWWNTKDVEDRYGHQMKWFKEKVFYVPRFKKQLDSKNGGCVHYSGNDDGRYWSFEPKRFKKFMEDNFPEINK